ncbi:hypothetical protein JZ751_016345, partial [Albula glossodonta]
MFFCSKELQVGYLEKIEQSERHQRPSRMCISHMTGVNRPCVPREDFTAQILTGRTELHTSNIK